MEHERETHKALYLIVFCLYLLPILSLGEDAITVYLYATKQLDDVALLSLILVFVGAQISLCYTGLHFLLARKHRLAGLYPPPRSFLHSTCRDTLRIMMLVWIPASATGLIVAARQPECLPGSSDREFWRFGSSCKLHRATVAIAVAAMVSSCALFCAIQLSDRPFHASLVGVYNPDPERQFDFGNSLSGSSWSSGSSGNSLKRQKLSHTRSHVVEHYSYGAKRQQGHSFQSAVYPPSLRYSVHRPLSPHRLYRTPSGNLRRTSPHGQFSFAPYPPPPPTQAPSSHPTIGHTIFPSPRKSPLSHMRRASEPEVPAIPDKFRATKRSPGLKQIFKLPDTWSPTLLHPPLSADPAIQAFSINNDRTENKGHFKEHGLSRRLSNAFTKRSSGSKPVALVPSDTIRLVNPSPDEDFMLQDPPKPRLPSRAKGHTTKPRVSVSQFHSPSPSAFRPSSHMETVTEPRRISRTPSCPPSDLHVPRSRPHSLSIETPSTGFATQVSIDQSYEILRKESLEEPRNISRISPPSLPLQSPRRKLSKRYPSRSRSYSRSRLYSGSLSQSQQSQPLPPAARSFSVLRPPELPTAASSIYSRQVSSSPNNSRGPSAHSCLRPTPPLQSIPFPRASHEADANLEVLRLSRRFSRTPPPPTSPPPTKMGNTTTVSSVTGTGTKGATSAIDRGEIDGRSNYGAYAFACSPFIPSSSFVTAEDVEDEEVGRGRPSVRGQRRRKSTVDENGVRTHSLTRVRSRDGRLVRSESHADKGRSR